MSPVGVIFVPSPPKTGTNLLHHCPSPIVERVSFLRSLSTGGPPSCLLARLPVYVCVCVCVCVCARMYVWSSHIAEYGSTG